VPSIPKHDALDDFVLQTKDPMVSFESSSALMMLQDIETSNTFSGSADDATADTFFMTRITRLGGTSMAG
jgi:hypothetical protein